MTAPIDLLTRWFDAHGRGDLVAAKDLVADDIDVAVPGARVRGFDAFMAWYEHRAKAYGPSFKYMVNDVCGGSAHACAILTLSTDERSWRQVAVYRVINERIVSIWAAEDLD